MWFLTFNDVRNICYIALRIAWETTFIYDFCLVPIYGFPPLSQLQHPSMYTSTEPFYKAYAILIHKAMVLTAIVPLPSHEPGQLLERLRCFKTQRRSLFQRRPFKKSPFQVAEKKKNATSSKQIQGTWCFGLNGHRRDPYVDDSVPEQCRLDVDLL